MRIICSCGYLSHSEPLFNKLNVLKIDGLFKLQLLTFCFDMINNNLPAHFIKMPSLLQPVIYHHNTRHKKSYSIARVKHILNKSNNIITDKINTHRQKWFTIYLKKILVNEYNSICLIQNCLYVKKLLFRNTQCTLDAGPFQLFLISVYVII